MRHGRHSLKNMDLKKEPGPDLQAEACARKVWFRTMEDALRGTTRKAYKCARCDGYHQTYNLLRRT